MSLGTLVLVDDRGQPLVVVLSGDSRIDPKAVANQVGARKVKFASREVVLQVTGYPAGGTPPVGHRTRLPVFVDTKVMDFQVGYGGGGHPNWLLRVRPAEIVRVTVATTVTISL